MGGLASESGSLAAHVGEENGLQGRVMAASGPTSSRRGLTAITHSFRLRQLGMRGAGSAGATDVLGAVTTTAVFLGLFCTTNGAYCAILLPNFGPGT